MASEAIKRMFFQSMLDNQRAQGAASKIKDIMGNQAQEQVTSPYDQADQLFPGEAPIQGLMNIDQEAKQATGLFDTANPNRFLEASQGMIESGNPLLQNQGLDMLKSIQAGAAPDDKFGWDKVKSFTVAAKQNMVDGKDLNAGLIDRAIWGPGGNIIRANMPFEKSNPFVDAGLYQVNRFNRDDKIDKNVSATEQNKVAGKNLAVAADEMINNYEALINRAGIYDEITASIEDGATTTALAKWAPTLRASTARLEAAGNSLALNLLTTVTMGSLSKSEMDILQQTVLPKMPSADLKEWVAQRKAAEEKLSNVYLRAAQAYGSGISRADFMASEKAASEAAKKPTRVWGK